MLPQRERPRAPSFLPAGFVDPAPAIFARFDAAQRRRVMPAPAPLPSLTEALARRAAVFGPVDLDEVTWTPHASLSPWQALGAVARRAVEALADRVRA